MKLPEKCPHCGAEYLGCWDRKKISPDGSVLAVEFNCQNYGHCDGTWYAEYSLQKVMKVYADETEEVIEG